MANHRRLYDSLDTSTLKYTIEIALFDFRLGKVKQVGLETHGLAFGDHCFNQFLSPRPFASSRCFVYDSDGGLIGNAFAGSDTCHVCGYEWILSIAQLFGHFTNPSLRIRIHLATIAKGSGNGHGREPCMPGEIAYADRLYFAHDTRTIVAVGKESIPMLQTAFVKHQSGRNLAHSPSLLSTS